MNAAPNQSHSDKPTHRRWARWLAGTLIVILTAFVMIVGPRIRHGAPKKAPTWAAGVREGKLSSEYCISCHKEAGALWFGSLHHLANRTIKTSDPAADFGAQPVSTHASHYRFSYDGGPLPVIEESQRDGTTRQHHPSMVIGHGTLRQFLIETKPGTFQTTEIAYDPAKQEWFGTFGNEERNPGEWGHWTGQSMNWNSMCARCHMTVYEKNYDEAQDRFRSKWVEQGIGCVQCHGPMTGHEKGGKAMIGVPNISKDPALMMQTCAACHSRAEDLTTSFPPGAKFEDHLRLQLMTDPRTYHADGQILDEVFEWGSFQHSKMGTAGVTCLDCHNPHTGKLRLPIENNSLCMQCHAEGNERKAPVIHPEQHSFHKPDSKGNRCVECHMAETTYMARDPRRDHGFIIPDPLLKKELGIPDACSSCHSTETIELNLQAWEKWYGSSGLTAPRRARTRAVAKAHAGDSSVVPELLRLLDTEKKTGWRASLLGLAEQLTPTNEAVVNAAKALRNDADPLVRAAAVRALSNHEPSRPLLREALRDPVRLVRLDAAWALSTELEADSEARRELDDYFNVMIESPTSLLRRGQDRFRRGLHEAGINDLRKAIAMDPLSAPFYEALGFMLNNNGRPKEAAEQFERAASLAPSDATPAYNAALVWAEAGNNNRTETMLRETVRRNPAHARAWYNLGLLLNQTGRSDESLQSLAKAEAAAPTDPDIPYAAATLLANRGNTAEAVAALQRALNASPGHQPSLKLLNLLRRK